MVDSQTVVSMLYPLGHSLHPQGSCTKLWRRRCHRVQKLRTRRYQDQVMVSKNLEVDKAVVPQRDQDALSNNRIDSRWHAQSRSQGDSNWPDLAIPGKGA